jgi:hypothetical protein
MCLIEHPQVYDMLFRILILMFFVMLVTCCTHVRVRVIVLLVEFSWFDVSVLDIFIFAGAEAHCLAMGHRGYSRYQ